MLKQATYTYDTPLREGRNYMTARELIEVFLRPISMDTNVESALAGGISVDSSEDVRWTGHQRR